MRDTRERHIRWVTYTRCRFQKGTFPKKKNFKLCLAPYVRDTHSHGRYERDTHKTDVRDTSRVCWSVLQGVAVPHELSNVWDTSRHVRDMNQRHILKTTCNLPSFMCVRHIQSWEIWETDGRRTWETHPDMWETYTKTWETHMRWLQLVGS